jgi:hypothetical protein
MTKTKSPGAVTALGASEIDQLGGTVDLEDSHPLSFTQGPIRAQLNGSDGCSALGITATGSTPVLALCRMLIETGVDPETPLEVFRGDILCLWVRSIGEAAELRVGSHGVGFEGGLTCAGGSAIAPTACGGPSVRVDAPDPRYGLCAGDAPENSGAAA